MKGSSISNLQQTSQKSSIPETDQEPIPVSLADQKPSIKFRQILGIETNDHDSIKKGIYVLVSLTTIHTN
ncbi:hypothetical protein H4Q26_006884 [Puccinia striiformis f. sp. tritici PST-130]|nr:hypothetical protein H4Q26_006884 [Puccinia striiformis f. sp. tritici PST-130]